MPNILRLRAEYGKGLQTSSLAMLRGDVKTIRSAYQKRNLLNELTPPNRFLTKALHTAERIADEWILRKNDIQPQLTQEEGGHMLIIRRVSWILDQIGTDMSSDLGGKLKLIARYTLDPTSTQHSSARESLFELETYARLKKSCKGVILRSGPGADLSFVHRFDMSQMECKFINSMGQVKERVADAVDQLNMQNNRVGIIALQIEAQVPHALINKQLTSKMAYLALVNAVNELTQKCNDIIQKLLRYSNNIRGIILHGHMPSLINGLNYVDVGLSTIVNSNVGAPKGSWQSRWLQDLARALADD